MLNPNPSMTIVPNCFNGQQPANIDVLSLTHCGHTTIWDVRRKLNEDDEPCFDVRNGFKTLLPFELVALDARQILFNSYDSLATVLFFQKPRGRWSVG